MIWKVLLYFVALFANKDHHHNSDEFEAYVPTPTGPQTLEEEAVARAALHGDKYGGDMVFPDGWNTTDAAVRNRWFRWPFRGQVAVIPFVMDPSILHFRNVIIQGMNAYHQLTCIRFVQRTNENDFIRIFNGNGCWSMIGKNGGVQNLSLGQGCGYVGLVIHELGHAIGLFHEHQRSDRDNYITVYRNNVVSGQEHNFLRTDPQNEIIYRNYDYNSIMHYGNYAFSKQPGRLPTMVAYNRQRLLEPYEKSGFTNMDLITIRKMYNC